MDVKLKTGILALATTSSFVFAAGALTLVLAARHPSPKSVPPPSPQATNSDNPSPRATHPQPSSPTSEEKQQEAQLVAAISRHPWWQKKLTEARVHQLADVLVAMQADDACEITPEGQEIMHPVGTYSRAGARAQYEDPGMGWIDARNLKIFLNGSRYVRRMTRTEALARLKSELDYEDVRKR